MCDMRFILFCACAAIVVPSVMNAPSARQENGEVISNTIPSEEDLKIVSREEWGARAPTHRDPLHTPVPHVIVHHTYEPGACAASAQCERAMRSMQNYHMDTHGWNDIGYSFCVGGDGKIYEGRGFTTLGAHAAGSNSVSVGICLIGDWTAAVPPQVQLDAAKALIKHGVALGYVQPDYTLLGHRQVRDTECPGDALFNEIKSWQHFSVHPTSHRELLSLARSNTIEKNYLVAKAQS